MVSPLSTALQPAGHLEHPDQPGGREDFVGQEGSGTGMGTGGKVLQNFFGQWQLNPAFERLMKNCLEWGTSAPRVAVDAIEGEYNPYSALPSVDKEVIPMPP